MRRMGWFVAGAATAAGAVAAGAVARRRLRGPEPDELPSAIGFEEAMAPAPEPADVEAAGVTASPVLPAADDAKAAELRTQIAESRRRLRAKARAATGENPDPDDDATAAH
ncbi:MAG: hypothetical protein ACTHNU_06345 [Gaiellales bacterium]